MHECHECGQACDCDGEDLWSNRTPRYHSHKRMCGEDCEGDDDDDDDDGFYD